MIDIINSIFIDANDVLYFRSADGTVFKTLTAFQTSSVMFTRHVESVSVTLTTNNAGILRWSIL